MNGAEAIVKFLQSKNVDTAFGYPGGPVLVLYEAIYRLDFPHILTRHEQGAVHAAEGYARVTGKPGVVIATSGPGATNLVTGIADAYLDSVPLLAITGAVARKDIGRDAFQEADITGITDPVTKYSYLVMEPEQLLPILEEAWQLTTSGRPGPVLVNIPKDIMAATIEERPNPAKMYVPLRPKPLKSDVQVDKVISCLKAARKPLLAIGGGCVISPGAPEELTKFIDSVNIPTAMTLMAKGALADTHPWNLGMSGMHGTLQANRATVECDLLLAVGCRFSDRLIANPDRYSKKDGRTIIHVDIDPAEIGKNVTPTIEIEDDAYDFFRVLNTSLAAEDSFKPDWDAWRADIRELSERYNAKVDELSKEQVPLLPQYVMRTCSKMTEGMDPIVVTDVGQHQMFACQHYNVESPRSFLTSGGLGTMGFGFPAAIGAAKAYPERLTIAVVGDGGFQMTLQELGLLEALDLPLIILVMDNGTLGMVRQWQELFFSEHYSHSMLNNNPDFVKIAEAYGVKGSKVDTPEQLKEAFAEAIQAKKPRLLHINIRQNENVYPMVPAGKDAEEIIMPGMTD